jgi:hypothetical protein
MFSFRESTAEYKVSRPAIHRGGYRRYREVEAR